MDVYLGSSSTPGAPSSLYITSDTFANIVAGYAAASYSGYQAWCTDGNGFAVRSNGTRWTSTSTHIMWSPLSAPVDVTGTVSETVIRQMLIPAGFLAAGYVIDMDQAFAKSGTAGNCLARVRIGTAGTTADATVVPAVTILNAASQSSRWCPKIRIVSATAASSNSVNSTANGPSTTVFPADVAIANVSNALYISTTVALGSAADTVTLKSSETYIGRV